jgi:hypothetical protein
MNPVNVWIGLAQVENCELPKDFIGQPIGDRALARPFIEEDLSRARHSVPSWCFVKYVNLLRWKVLLDMCMRKSEVWTYWGLRGDLCLSRDIQSNPVIVHVVNSMIAMLV